MIERAKLFHRQFPDKRIKPRSLLSVYSKHRIHRKMVRMIKIQEDSKMEEYEVLRSIAREQLQEKFNRKIKVIFCDEVVFTKKTCQLREYSNKYKNIVLDQKDLNSPYLSVIAAISTDDTVEALAI